MLSDPVASFDVQRAYMYAAQDAGAAAILLRIAIGESANSFIFFSFKSFKGMSLPD